MNAILVFGAGGQLGCELVDSATRHGIRLLAFRRSEADITDRDAVARALDSAPASVVVNLAAYTNVDRAEAEPRQSWHTNVTGPEILARACETARLPLVHLSTDYVFDGSKQTAYTEDDPVSPRGIYGRTKAEGEAMVRRFAQQHVILRTSWLYGRYGRNFLKSILQLAGETDELRVVADQRGCPTGTVDVAEAILHIAPIVAAREPVWGTYHLAGTGATTRHGFATEIVEAQAELTNRRPTVVPISSEMYPSAAKRPGNSELDSSRFNAMFGFRAADWRWRTREVVAGLVNRTTARGS